LHTFEDSVGGRLGSAGAPDGLVAIAVGIRMQIGNHTFRATGITEYLHNGGKLETACPIGGLTTRLPRCRRETVTLTTKSTPASNAGSLVENT
jgi:hypothetical protein